MPAMTDPERERRELRRRIGRLRRRIDRRVRSAQREGRRLADWQTYVRRYPEWAVAAAFGVGLSLAAGLRPAVWSRWLGLRLVRQAFDRFIEALVGEVAKIWADSTPDRPKTPPAGGDHA
jgi:hypothetical protein